MPDKHFSLDELAERVVRAKELVSVGARYQHYKGNFYKVLDVSLIEETVEPCVVYQPEYEPRISYVRPLNSWLATVEVDGKVVPRFAKID